MKQVQIIEQRLGDDWSEMARVEVDSNIADSEKIARFQQMLDTLKLTPTRGPIRVTVREITKNDEFIAFLANRHPADGLTKAQILRMADKLMHGGTWDGEKVVLDVRTPLEMAQGRILELEAEVDRLTEQLGGLAGLR